MYSKITLGILMVTCWLGLPASASDKENMLSATDVGFIKEVSLVGLFEVELGKLATSRSGNGNIKAYGRMVQEDHTRINSEVKRLVDGKGIIVASRLRGKQKESYDRFLRVPPTKFGKEYMKTMIEDHEKDIAQFQQISETTENVDVKNFAIVTLPVLKKHLQEAKRVMSSIEALSWNN